MTTREGDDTKTARAHLHLVPAQELEVDARAEAPSHDGSTQALDSKTPAPEFSSGLQDRLESPNSARDLVPAQELAPRTPAPEFSSILSDQMRSPNSLKDLSPAQVPASSNVSLSELPDHTREVMKKGSKSFSLAALLFDKESREGAQYLYAWCRTCDDEIDNETDPAKQLERLNELREKTARAFADKPSGDPAFQAFRELCRKYKIEEAHPQALLEGMRMDVEGSRIRNDEDLLLYCYRVAGVVGLMMSQVMGVTDPKAQRHAIDTGLAMQMSNIARDIKEDFNLKRIYIPDSWFANAQPPSLEKPFHAEDFTPHVERLLAKAETLYSSGEKGLRYLPFRASLAVAAAQTIYREIGRKVLRRGTHAWDTRTVVPKPRKLWLMTIAITKRCLGALFS